MNSNFIRLLLSVILFCLVISCSRPEREFAVSSAPKDFDGKWNGNWSWNPSATTSVEISGTEVTVTGFPISESSDRISVISAHGKATFDPAYGAKGTPCVLLSFTNSMVDSALFITKDKNHLIYTVDINYDRQITFRKSTD